MLEEIDREWSFFFVEIEDQKFGWKGISKRRFNAKFNCGM